MPVFVIRAIIDNAIPDGDKRQIVILASLAVAAALGDAVLAIVQRWASAKVGEGLIYDLRSALFAKIQRMPIAFFTRTPTGSITSRLNNDVIGAQTAVTSTLGSVVSNVIVLVDHTGRDDRARVAPHAADAGGAAAVHRAGAARRGCDSRGSHASRWATTRR